ncbi:MAG: hypothetical protein CL732_01550 [Chloroflexi bacterium]|nr:hypothetical protein [Chloroflexota bacterium]
MATGHTEVGGVTGPGSNMILVVEDDERTSRLERFVLEEEGYSVTCVNNGEDALLSLHTTSPTLILLDIVLPQMDGFTTCQKIRESSQVPIIMVTAEGRDEDKVRGLEMGADDYITKPFSTNELAARVNAVLRRINASKKASLADRPRRSEPDMSFLDQDQGSAGPSEEPADDAPDQDESSVENYEGSVKLVVEAKGEIRNMAEFMDTLRENPEFHLLRMVSNAKRDGMDVWLRLRQPNPLKATLLNAAGVATVEDVDDAEVDPVSTDTSTNPYTYTFDIDYTITVDNIGVDDLTLAGYIDLLPVGFSYVSTSQTGDITEAPSQLHHVNQVDRQRITWNFSSDIPLPSGTAQTLEFTATATVTQGNYWSDLLVDFGGGSFPEDRYSWPTALVSVKDVHDVTAVDKNGNAIVIALQVWIGDQNGVINTWNLP